MKFFSTIPQFHYWLLEIIKKSGLSQGKIADRSNIDRSRFSRFLNGKEAIPNHAITWISNCLGLTDEDQEYAIRIHEADYLARKIEDICDQISPEFHPFFSKNLTRKLITISEQLAISDIIGSQNKKLDRLIKNLKNSLMVLNWIKTLLVKEESILTDLNAPMHILYPFNKMIGALIKLEPESTLELDGINTLRKAIISDFRAASRQKNTNLKKQHAIYMLARYGNSNDLNIAASCCHSENIFLKRMAIFGMLFSEETSEDGNKLLYLMDSNQEFTKAVLYFDAIHYGDSRFEEDIFSTKINGLTNTLGHFLIYLNKGEENIFFDITLRKMLEILHIFGPNAFQNFHTDHIKNTIKLCVDKNQKSHTMKRFVNDFEAMLRKQAS